MKSTPQTEASFDLLKLQKTWQLLDQPPPPQKKSEQSVHQIKSCFHRPWDTVLSPNFGKNLFLGPISNLDPLFRKLSSYVLITISLTVFLSGTWEFYTPSIQVVLGHSKNVAQRQLAAPASKDRWPWRAACTAPRMHTYFNVGLFSQPRQPIVVWVAGKIFHRGWGIFFCWS